jgi:YD repeat-containing protein
MPWTNDATTTTTETDATSTAARGWEQPIGASAKLSSESFATSSTSDSVRCGVQGGGQFRDNSGGNYPEILPVSVSKDGGTVTIDEFNRVTQMQDAAHRQFQFGYDNKSGDLNTVTNADGTWKRQIHHGKYTDEWKNGNEKWKGAVEVSPDGYSFTKDNERITYTPNGSQTKEYLSDGKTFYSDTTLANGQHKVVDGRLPAPCPADDANKGQGKDKLDAGKKPDGSISTDKNGLETKTTKDGTVVTDKKAMKETTYYDAKEQHLKAVHDLKNNSQLNYDQQGNLTSMKDAHGQTTSFKDYDTQGNPHSMENDKGVFHKIGPDLWNNDNPAKTNKVGKDGSAHNTLHIHLQVNKDGYTISDQQGKTWTGSADGTTVEQYKGVKTTTDAQGKVSKQLVDGSPLQGDPIKGSVDFTVKKGDTKSGHLNISSNDFEVVHAKGGDVHAHIEAPPHAPVGAMQDGLVVYTYNHDPKVAGSMEQRATSVIGLSQGDMDVINHYRTTNPNEDLMVMQCYDPKSKGVRYEIYAGLNLANAAPGARIKAGEVLGTAGDRGYEFAARKGRVSGQAVELTL